MHDVDTVHLSGDLGNVNDVLKYVVGLPARNERDWTILLLRICGTYCSIQRELPLKVAAPSSTSVLCSPYSNIYKLNTLICLNTIFKSAVLKLRYFVLFGIYLRFVEMLVSSFLSVLNGLKLTWLLVETYLSQQFFKVKCFIRM